MSSKELRKLSKEELIRLFNDHLFSIESYNQTEVIDILIELKTTAYGAFPKIVSALKRKSRSHRYLEHLKQLSIREAIDYLIDIFEKVKDRKAAYFIFEAIGLLDWKNLEDKEQEKVKLLLSNIEEEGFIELYRFLAINLAAWHFGNVRFFDSLIMTDLSIEEDRELVEPMILKILEYSITDDNNHLADYRVAQLAGHLQIKKAIPLLKKACKKIRYNKEGLYEYQNDFYCDLRAYAIRSLGNLVDKSDTEAKNILIDILQHEPNYDVILEAIFVLSIFDDEEIKSYLEGIKNKSFGQFKFQTKTEETELLEAINRVLDLRKTASK